MKLISDAKFGRKKAPEPQQNGQSTDGAVSNRSSSREENRQKTRQLLQMESYLHDVLNFIEDVFWKFQCEGSMKRCKGIFKFICLLEIPVRGFYVLFPWMRRRCKARFNFDDGSSFLFSILLVNTKKI
ncbi:hypothetical protein DVH24_036107 [Malus domestica]|uniref:Uncharacterized protein n=1 Tax=Malus domestica TaxID=3750 RepID=A0A498IEA3_MALDO|nr:hypothetical protein DVH24_036107 [Malus domestica]